MFNKYPEIYFSLFGNSNKHYTNCYAIINATMLKELTEKIKSSEWRINIKDTREGDETPHYVLEFGSNLENDFKSLPRSTQFTEYCDTWSDIYSRKIEQALGQFRVDAIGDFGEMTPKQIASLAIKLYFDAIGKVFTNHCVVRQK